MKGKPLYPFAVTAILGIALIVVLSFIGLDQSRDMAGEDNGGEETPQFDDPIELGEYVYEQNCINCHGGDLAGVGSNPAINGLEGVKSEEEIVAIIHEGPGAMPAFPQLGEEAEAVAQYILSFSE
ncbi:cytochrome c550 [Evansella cellulosilytica]|uniref:Cytochrome c class I n=1 Tax=Evansella cellulosilytica (strain ATCC 21833 / DSM 2522 / FERM P-1141 / JCM 9156 / N-4) TaxID=649639 RepID=E6TW59_EVAC2|nr:cytochrome c [Evansella cellulosilytica]ADU29882.1 cytochrome c class I [Evansella cellulosilytica DSM 2522]